MFVPGQSACHDKVRTKCFTLALVLEIHFELVLLFFYIKLSQKLNKPRDNLKTHFSALAYMYKGTIRADLLRMFVLSYLFMPFYFSLDYIVLFFDCRTHSVIQNCF